MCVALTLQAQLYLDLNFLFIFLLYHPSKTEDQVCAKTKGLRHHSRKHYRLFENDKGHAMTLILQLP
jgi:hypothetical protein